jgi:hypothetical protein
VEKDMLLFDHGMVWADEGKDASGATIYKTAEHMGFPRHCSYIKWNCDGLAITRSEETLEGRAKPE